MEEIRIPNIKTNFEGVPTVLTLKELQNILGIGRNLAYSLVEKQLIKSFKIGREWKILKTELISFIENQLMGETSERKSTS